MTFDRESPVAKTYQVWHVLHPLELVEAKDSFTARKEYAARHRLPVHECAARRLDLGKVNR